MAQKNSSRRNKNVISNVRIVDDDATDSLKVNRMVGQIHDTKGQIRVLCDGTFNVSPTQTITGSYTDFSTIIGTDDFVSFAAQFTEYRVRAIKFDVYDVNPSVPVVLNYFATYHQIGGTVASAFTDIVDRPDAKVIAPGTGVSHFYWNATGIPEMEFQSTGTGSSTNLGGLVYNTQASSTNVGTKYQVVFKAIVDFRGRT